MLRAIAKQVVSKRLLKAVPLARVLVVAQLALLAKRHVEKLSGAERRRFVELARKGRRLTKAERQELRELTFRVDPKSFALNALDELSPVPLPKRKPKR